MTQETLVDPTTLIKFPAKIAETFLGIEDHGILTAIITVNYGGGGYQGIGHYELDQRIEKDRARSGTAFGMEFIRRILKTAGVSSWSNLVGQPLFVLKQERFEKVYGISGFPDGEPFLFQDLLNEYYDPIRSYMR